MSNTRIATRAVNAYVRSTLAGMTAADRAAELRMSRSQIASWARRAGPMAAAMWRSHVLRAAMLRAADHRAASPRPPAGPFTDWHAVGGTGLQACPAD
jgi:hypothetical protein